ncbi:hypothetical protein VTJ83DRAFT_2799 [Remersonia thermophila]|uniref:Carboxyvinyl-carboxyphosphonate phosphorylmutase n=1 Tax=Remersonia thermophila TaxID=72144 RepID=A0ABR4DKD9_9PEZI
MSAPSTTTLAARAREFKAFHAPGSPLRLANVYDATSARIIGSLPGCRALASASHAVAEASGTTDEHLTLEQNLTHLAPVAAVAHELGLPLTIDLQDGYGERLEEAVCRAITELGAVGINLEDSRHEDGSMMDEDEAVERIRRSLQVAADLGVPDFVVNARSDTFLMKAGSLDESIRRGRKYLEAGATTVYVIWPFDQEMLAEDVKKVVGGLDGMVNILPRKASTVQSRDFTPVDVAQLGAARISVGPLLYRAMREALTDVANEVFTE